MKSFKEYYLTEAYNVIPTSADDIAKLGSKPVPELIKLFNLVQQQTKSAMPDPLAIEGNKNHKVKIVRALADRVDLRSLRREFPTLNIAIGNGSRGNQGAANRGNLFEVELADDMRKWIAEGDDAEFMYPQFIKDFMVKELSNAKEIEVIDEGALNKPRPLRFQGKKIYVGSNNFDIGATVTDITVKADGKPYYLSLKMGGTVTFFNSGVRKLFPDSAFTNREIKSKEAKALLDLFAIDHDRFVNIFADYVKPEKKAEAPKDVVDVTRLVDKKILQEFIKSGVGSGYWLVHKVGKKIHVEEMAGSNLNKWTKPLSVKLGYPKGGSAKRIDMTVETPKFTLKFTIRNKSGGVNPTHIMSDYKIKGH
jgi:hypothetical protein